MKFIEQKLLELADQKKYLTAELESTLDDMQNIYHRASERTVFLRPVGKNSINCCFDVVYLIITVIIKFLRSKSSSWSSFHST